MCYAPPETIAKVFRVLYSDSLDITRTGIEELNFMLSFVVIVCDFI